MGALSRILLKNKKVNVTRHMAKYGDPYSEFMLCIKPIQSSHTHTHTHTHPEQCSAIYAVAPREQLGVRCLAQGHLVVVLKVQRALNIHSPPPPPPPPPPPRICLLMFFLPESWNINKSQTNNKRTQCIALLQNFSFGLNHVFFPFKYCKNVNKEMKKISLATT